MDKISVVINTKDEAEYLKKAICSVKDWADEIVVVDMESEDKSAEIAIRLGAKVYSHKPLPYVEPARNFAISKVKNDWVLVLDPDEEIGGDLQKRLNRLVENNEADYARIPRKNIIFGKWVKHSRWWPDYNIRFFKKGSVEWNEIIHGVPLTHGRGIDLDEKENLAIIHHHYQSIEQFIERMNRYSSVQAQLLANDNKTFDWKNLLSKPASEFMSRYFAGSGYKDGMRGLALAILQAISEVTVQLKLWQLEKFPDKKLSLKAMIKQMRGVEDDFHYWYADALLKENGGLTNRLRRKLKI